jgi:hypothetical protein
LCREIADGPGYNSIEHSGRWKIHDDTSTGKLSKEMRYTRHPTKPAPGVMVMRPEIAPEQNPTTLHLLPK